MQENKRIGIFFVWLLTVPPFLYYMIETAGAMWLEHMWSILGFMILITLVSIFPVEIKGTTFIPVHGVSLAVFLHFGLLTEVLLTQVAILVVLLSLRLPPEERFRMPLNSLIFLLTSLFSGGAFYLFGGTTGSASFESITAQVIPVVIYTLVYFLANNVLIYFVQRVLQKKKVRFLSEGLTWEAVTAIFILPVGVTLAYLYHELGMVALPLIGVPVVAASLILKFYHDGKHLIDQLQQVSEFGHEINSMTDSEAMYERYLEACYTMFPADGVLLFDPPINGNDRLVPVYLDCPGNRTDMAIRNGDPVSKTVIESGEAIRYRSRREAGARMYELFSSKAESMLSVPAVRGGQVTGVSSLVSTRKKAFTKKHQMLLEILLNHLTVSINNARHLERAQKESMQCALTKLHNYRFFERTLQEHYEGNDDDFAVILLDLDHFKSVNDRFGHSAGNQVLHQVARTLESAVTSGKAYTVARYGGEEFVILLDQTTAEDATDQAEQIRQTLEETVFHVDDDLQQGGQTKALTLTASIGVAARRADDEDPLGIVRNADRAMYTGAKNNGRNKVAVYPSEATFHPGNQTAQ
ncbi:sensor domain-containing diguanylate cyclase [Salisediminibacterium selenitireducens]|uniref:Diguanylate cyclase with GAF sensor n=1 Tax=Bacillus selenitireducens (strain ATCC 700615 / DSM 15326 / MLS10) TaxID=439292 RepID=D6XT12_BACIE|nr:sensor domain-containing diguanylate cyclase [Salisediminibacterium selenitireducens]ADH98948.1 diguanylate cyclase with GAF sensor [[Bacillus] selenitireducens MLS10]